MANKFSNIGGAIIWGTGGPEQTQEGYNEFSILSTWIVLQEPLKIEFELKRF